MSYSFNVRAATKQEVVEKVLSVMNKTIEQQPEHQADADTAVGTINNMLDALVPREGYDFAVRANGSVSLQVAGTPEQPERRITQVDFNCTVYMPAKE